MPTINLTPQALKLLSNHNQRIVKEIADAIKDGRINKDTRPLYSSHTYGEELTIRTEAQLELTRAES